MPKILVAMSADAYERVMSAASRERLTQLGDVTLCLNARDLDEETYGSLWAEADVCLSGWGVRVPAVLTSSTTLRLRAICHSAGSVRMFPRGVIERGITVTSARSAIARTVAEFALVCTLMLLRRMSHYLHRREGKPDSETLFDKTVSLIGCGCVGRHLRDLLRPFGCRVLVYDPYMTVEQAAELEVELVSLKEALARGRIVSLHAPDTPETRGMIGREELALLGDGAVLVNTARGRLIDTNALVQELEEGRIWSALDVTEPEPLPTDHPLRRLDNALLTPHIAGPTTDDLKRLGELAVLEIERALHGEPPLYPIDLTAYDRMSF